MNVVTVKKAVVKTTVPNTNPDAQTTQSTQVASATTATPVKVAGRPRTNAVATYQKPLFLSIRDVQKLYLPMLSLKRIRKIVNNNVHTIKAGNKLLVNREQLEILLRNPEIKTI